MQFKILTAVLLGLTATGVVANPMPADGAAIEVRAEQAEQGDPADLSFAGKNGWQRNKYTNRFDRPGHDDREDWDEDWNRRGDRGRGGRDRGRGYRQPDRNGDWQQDRGHWRE